MQSIPYFFPFEPAEPFDRANIEHWTRLEAAWVHEREQPMTTKAQFLRMLHVTRPDVAASPLAEAIFEAMHDLVYESDPFCADLPHVNVARLTDAELVNYRKRSHARKYYLQHQAVIDEARGAAFIRMLTPFSKLVSWPDSDTLFTVPLYSILPDCKATVEALCQDILNPQIQGLFSNYWDAIFSNLRRISGGSSTLVHATKSTLSDADCVNEYLQGTTFRDLLCTPVPVSLGERSAHHLIIGGAGSGKTSMMERLLLSDLRDAGRPSVILIDPHSDLVNRIIRADLGIDDRIIHIDYRDIEHPPQINIFAPNRRVDTYDRAMREQVSASVIDTFEYLFSGLFNLALTGRQATLFRYVTRLLLTLPETLGRPATILDMLDLTDEKKVPTYQPAISKLGQVQREFFERDYIPAFKDTRQQIRGRLQALIDSPTLERLLSSRETKIDLFAELNRGCVLLIDTAEGFLGADGAATMGRLWISLIFQALLERQAIPEGQRRPTYLYIDEALTFAFDTKMASLLREVRKYGCGAILASQELPKDADVRSALSANTAIKMVCRPSAADAGALAPDMRTDKEFILSQPQLQFATYVPTVPQAVSVPVRPGTFANLPQRDPTAFIARNRARVSGERSYPMAAEEGRPFQSPPPSEPDYVDE